MTEETKRNSTRTKKIPSYLRMDDNQYGLYSASRNIDAKENKGNLQELNQTAKLLAKFIIASNQRSKLNVNEDVCELSIYDKNSSGAMRIKTDFQAQKMIKNSLGNNEAPNTANKNHREKGNLSNGTNKTASKNYLKKDQMMKNGKLGLSSTIQSDLSYHKMLGQHIRQTLPDQRNLSAETLMKLGLPPKELLQQIKLKEGDRKKSESGVSKNSKVKEQLKPFRRQSYHVGVAYHIYIKNVRGSQNPKEEELDPTYKARQLRQRAMKK